MAGSASTGYFGFAFETTEGTSVAPKFFLPVKDVNFPVDVEFIDVPEIRGSRQASMKYDGPVSSSATFTSSFYPSLGMGALLKALFGNVTSTAVGGSTVAFKHVFSDAATLPSMSLERSDTTANGTGLLHERLKGCKVESLSVAAAFGEDIDVSVDVMGLGFPEKPATKPSAITYPAVEPFLFTGASIKIDGVDNAYFKSIDFDFTNTLEPQQTLRKTRDAYRIYEGGMDLTLSGTLAFEDNSLYQKFKDSEFISVEAIFEGGMADPAEDIPYSATFTWPKVKVASHDTPMTAGEVMELDVEFEISFDPATNQRVQVELVNKDNAAAYN